MQSLPQQVINEVLRFRYHEDRRLKLFGKLMVRKYYQQAGLEFNWNNWHVSSNGKPYYKYGKVKFNISHSGEYVMVAFSENEVGVDIEGVAEFDIGSLNLYFHPKEVEYIKTSSDSTGAFFRLWTRKEAYLKAIGKGIIDELQNESCLQDKMTDSGIWFLHSLSIIPRYKVAICTDVVDCKINIRELSLIEF